SAETVVSLSRGRDVATIETAWRELTAALEGEVVLPAPPRVRELPTPPRAPRAGRGARVCAALGVRARDPERRPRLRRTFVRIRDRAGPQRDALGGCRGRRGPPGARPCAWAASRPA